MAAAHGEVQRSRLHFVWTPEAALAIDATLSCTPPHRNAAVLPPPPAETRTHPPASEVLWSIFAPDEAGKQHLAVVGGVSRASELARLSDSLGGVHFSSSKLHKPPSHASARPSSASIRPAAAASAASAARLYSRRRSVASLSTATLRAPTSSHAMRLVRERRMQQERSNPPPP